MCNIPRIEMKYRDEFANDFMSQTYSSYLDYKYNYEESRLSHLIKTKYLKVLGKFIEDMYPGLKFDIFIRSRNPKEKSPYWYGVTYMELRIFDVIKSPVYNPMTFDAVYRTPHYDGYVSGHDFFDTINDFIPEINKHLLISFSSINLTHLPISQMVDNMLEIPDFECWKEYYNRDSVSNVNYDRFRF